MFFFFKQKTAYELRISDWSSDVCSSDLERLLEHVEVQLLRHQADQAHRLVAAGMQVDAEHPHLARGLVHQRGDDADQGRLAGAVGAEKAVEITWPDVPRDALAGLYAAVVGLAQGAHRQARRGRRRAPRAGMRGCGPGGRGG